MYECAVPSTKTALIVSHQSELQIGDSDSRHYTLFWDTKTCALSLQLQGQTKAKDSSKTLITSYQTRRFYIPQDDLQYQPLLLDRIPNTGLLPRN
jgi:hypothetical protein